MRALFKDDRTTSPAPKVRPQADRPRQDPAKDVKYSGPEAAARDVTQMD